jgi:peptidyl-prolyl cis-trans isomerase A (cyclophilin A)
MKPVVLIALCAACVFPETRVAGVTAASETAVEPGLYAIITTSMGSITAKLFEKEAAQTVSHFVALATGHQAWKDPQAGAMVETPLYRNLIFDHVIPDYVIQTGDPTNTGTYDCGIRVKDEFVDGLSFDQPGRLGLRNFGQPNTGVCQFFITSDAYPALDRSARSNGYTIFGQVVGGQEVVDRISMVPVDVRGRPHSPVRLVSVTIQRVGPGPAVPEPKKAAPRKKFLSLD